MERFGCRSYSQESKGILQFVPSVPHVADLLQMVVAIRCDPLWHIRNILCIARQSQTIENWIIERNLKMKLNFGEADCVQF